MALRQRWSTMPTQSEIENELRSFFLGRLSVESREHLESRLIEDPELFETAEALESEMIDEYAYGTMTTGERVDFERWFLVKDSRRKRVEIARSLAAQPIQRSEISTPASWVDSLRFLFSPVIAVTLILIAGACAAIFMWSRARQSEPQVATVSPTPQPSPENALNSTDKPAPPINVTNDQPKSNRPTTLPPVNANIVQPSPPSTHNNPVVALVAGRLRSDGRMNLASIPPTARGVTFRLRIDDAAFDSFHGEIIDEGGQTVFKTGSAKPRGRWLSFVVPADRLSDGDFAFRLKGVADAVAQPVADYQFRVRKK